MQSSLSASHLSAYLRAQTISNALCTVTPILPETSCNPARSAPFCESHENTPQTSMTANTDKETGTPPDYEALNNAFYSIVDSLFPKDFGQKGVQQTDADVLVKNRRAKEKERHRYVSGVRFESPFLRSYPFHLEPQMSRTAPHQHRQYLMRTCSSASFKGMENLPQVLQTPT